MKDVEEGTPSTATESVSNSSTGDVAQQEGTDANFVYQEEPIDETPKLYVPTDKPQPAYQNPDEDYNMTVDQAKTYQNVIRNSAKRVKKQEEILRNLRNILYVLNSLMALCYKSIFLKMFMKSNLDHLLRNWMDYWFPNILIVIT